MTLPLAAEGLQINSAGSGLHTPLIMQLCRLMLEMLDHMMFSTVQ